MSRASIVQHYNKLRMTKSELIEQLAGMELKATEFETKCIKLETNAIKLQGKAEDALIEAAQSVDGYLVDIERLREARDKLHTDCQAAHVAKRERVAEANGQVQELQKLVAELRADLDVQKGWRRHLRDQRNEAIGFIQGMRSDINTVADQPSKLDQLLEQLHREPEPYSDHNLTDVHGPRRYS